MNTGNGISPLPREPAAARLLALATNLTPQNIEQREEELVAIFQNNTTQLIGELIAHPHLAKSMRKISRNLRQADPAGSKKFQTTISSVQKIAKLLRADQSAQIEHCIASVHSSGKRDALFENSVMHDFYSLQLPRDLDKIRALDQEARDPILAYLIQKEMAQGNMHALELPLTEEEQMGVALHLEEPKIEGAQEQEAAVKPAPYHLHPFYTLGEKTLLKEELDFEPHRNEEKYPEGQTVEPPFPQDTKPPYPYEILQSGQTGSAAQVSQEESNLKEQLSTSFDKGILDTATIRFVQLMKNKYKLPEQVVAQLDFLLSHPLMHHVPTPLYPDYDVKKYVELIQKIYHILEKNVPGDIFDRCSADNNFVKFVKRHPGPFYFLSNQLEQHFPPVSPQTKPRVALHKVNPQSPFIIAYRSPHTQATHFVDLNKILATNDFEQIFSFYHTFLETIPSFERSSVGLIRKAESKLLEKLKELKREDHQALEAISHIHAKYLHHCHQIETSLTPKELNIDQHLMQIVKELHAKRLESQEKEIDRLLDIPQAKEIEGGFQGNLGQLCTFLHANELRQAIKKTHVVLIHGSHFNTLLGNILATQLMQAFGNKTFAPNTYTLRHPLYLEALAKGDLLTVEDYKQFMREGHEDREVSRGLLCADIDFTAWNGTESALSFSGSKQLAKTPFSMGIIEEMLRYHFPDPVVCNELYAEIIQLAEKLSITDNNDIRSMLGMLFICIPKEKFAETSFFAGSYGKLLSMEGTDSLEEILEKYQNGVRAREDAGLPYSGLPNQPVDTRFPAQVRVAINQLVNTPNAMVIGDSDLSPSTMAALEDHIKLLIQKAQVNMQRLENPQLAREKYVEAQKEKLDSLLEAVLLAVDNLSFTHNVQTLRDKLKKNDIKGSIKLTKKILNAVQRQKGSEENKVSQPLLAAKEQLALLEELLHFRS